MFSFNEYTRCFVHIFVYLTYFYVRFVTADDSCSISGVPENTKLLKISITDKNVNTLLFNGTTNGVQDITLSKDIGISKGIIDESLVKSYFDYNISSQTFYLSTTSQFEDFSRNVYTDGESSLTITLLFEVTCSSSSPSKVNFIVTVADSMSHKPTFLGSNYEYKVPMPIMPKADFSVYGTNSIEAEDINFSNNKLTFHIVPPDFVVNALQIGNKTFKAIFQANDWIRLTSDKLYKLTATDSGLNNNTVDITISVNKSSGLDIPHFSSTYYKYIYNASSSDKKLTTTEDIKIESNKDVSLANIALDDGDYDDYFEINLNNEVFSLSLSSKVLPSKFEPIFLKLSCTTDVTSYATLIITNVENKTPEENLYFQESYYTYIYEIKNGNPDLILNGSNIMLINKYSAKVNLSLTGDFYTYFTPTLEADGSTINLNVDKLLPPSNSNLIKLTLDCKTSDTSASTDIVVIKEAEEDQDKFEKNNYSFNFTANKPGANLVPNDEDITIRTTKTYKSTDLVFTGEYKKYFTASIKDESLVATEHTVTVKLSTEETKFPSTQGNTIILTLSLSNSVYTTIVISNNIALPTFSRKYYSGHYDPVTAVVTLDNEIDVSDNTVELNLEDSPMASYFTITKNNTKFEIYLKKNLPTELLKNTSSIILTLVVKNEEESRCPLVINLPPAKSETTVKTTWYMVAIIILAILLIITIAASLVLWYFKYRTRLLSDAVDEAHDDTQEKKAPTFLKNNSKLNPKIDNFVRRPTGFVSDQDVSFTSKDSEDFSTPTKNKIDNETTKASPKLSDDEDERDSANGSMVPSRRATGFVFNPPPADDDDIGENPFYKSDNELSPKRERKSVAFDNVEDNENSEKSDKIASRRPTTFSFGYPLEKEVYNNEESSDGATSAPKERKKSVAFNDQVERMHVDNSNIDHLSEIDSSTHELLI